MSMHPMISALRRHKAGVALIVLQVALTLAIVCNALFIIGARIERIHRSTGLDEKDLFLVTQQWAGIDSADRPSTLERLDAMQREDLAALRRLPEVDSVTPINSLPLLGSAALNDELGRSPGSVGMHIESSFYFADQNVLKTLGLRLVSGRSFVADDVQHQAFGDAHVPSVVIVSEQVAQALFPNERALGKSVYLGRGSKPAKIVGIVARLQTPGTNAYSTRFAYNSVLVPSRLDSTYSRYAIRAKAGQLDAAMRAVPSALYQLNAQRVILDNGIRSYAQIKWQAYRADIGMSVLMGGVSLILLCVTAAGVFGLTSFWVDQRKRQIGIRRALGARRRDILSYFQVENFLIVGTGAFIGMLLAVGLNLWLITRYEMSRLPVVYVLMGMAVVILLSQFSTFIPARRAARVEPGHAVRGANTR
jgi:putative ABC transport system permease protein